MLKTSDRRALGPTGLRIKNASLRNLRVGAALPCQLWNLDWSVFNASQTAKNWEVTARV
jgi:hypothetical protein